jgi:sirohydrochlorin cobaltochelatase
MPATDHALLLFSHGSPDPEWARPLEALQARLAARLAPMPVRLAFLPPASQDFMSVVGALVETGTRSLTVAPVFLARGGHVKKDLPEMAAQAEARWQLAITILPTLGESDLVLNAMADWVQSKVPGG